MTENPSSSSVSVMKKGSHAGPSSIGLGGSTSRSHVGFWRGDSRTTALRRTESGSKNMMNSPPFANLKHTGSAVARESVAGG